MKRKQIPDLPLIKSDKNEFIYCQCGCKRLILKFSDYRKTRRFINGHNYRTQSRNQLGQWI